MPQSFVEVVLAVGIACKDRLLPRSVLKFEIDDRAFGQCHGFAEAAVVGDVCAGFECDEPSAGFECDEPIDGVACSELVDIASLQRSGGQRFEYSHSQLVVGLFASSTLGWNREGLFMPISAASDSAASYPATAAVHLLSERLSRGRCGYLWRRFSIRVISTVQSGTSIEG